MKCRGGLLENNTMKITFYYVRHGQTYHNQQGIMQGQSGSALTENGFTQARRARDELKNIPITKAYVSPLLRAKQMAEVILEGRDIPTSYDAGLIETYFGSAEEKPYEDNDHKRRFNETDWKDLGGEDEEDVKNRIVSFMNKVIQESEDGDTILLVGHGDYFLILVHTYFGYTKYQQKEIANKNHTKRLPEGGIASFVYNDGEMELVHLMKERL